MPSSIKFKVISALHKCFYDDSIEKFPSISGISLLKGEKASFQAVYFDTKPDNALNFAHVCIEGNFKTQFRLNRLYVCHRPTPYAHTTTMKTI